MDKNQEKITNLLDCAKKITGSDYATAKALGIPPSSVGGWRNGSRVCAPTEIALVAHIAGMDASEWLITATLEKYEGTKRGELLWKALGKVSALTIGATSLNASAASAIYSIDSIGKSFINFIQYILSGV